MLCGISHFCYQVWVVRPLKLNDAEADAWQYLCPRGACSRARAKLPRAQITPDRPLHRLSQHRMISYTIETRDRQDCTHSVDLLKSRVQYLPELVTNQTVAYQYSEHICPDQ